MENTSNRPMEGHTPEATKLDADGLSVSSERGFTYLEMVISLALVTTIFPFVFSIFTTVYNDVRKQMLEHQLYEQYHQFQTQLMRDAANGVTIVGQDNQLIMTMGDGEQVRYIYLQGQIIRSVRQNVANSFRGRTILLYHVSKVTFYKQEKGLRLSVDLMDRNARFIGSCYVWGRIDV
jgi:type II secretory pathway pseudopilin PulG